MPPGKRRGKIIVYRAIGDAVFCPLAGILPNPPGGLDTIEATPVFPAGLGKLRFWCIISTSQNRSLKGNFDEPATISGPARH